MFTIRFDTELSDYLTGEYEKTVGILRDAADALSSVSEYFGKNEGFGTDRISEQIKNEAFNLKKLTAELEELRRKTEKICGIYCCADSAINADINKLPVLIHGNISSQGFISDILENVRLNYAPSHQIRANTLLWDNSVMYEDWLIKLIAKNNFGE